ncbi:MAG TPA: hypothetical protein VLC71_05000 [Thermomonas sp.]|nr:hypothetical protein [Thermomonas sp.]
MTDDIVLRRIRNQIISYLELAASKEEQIEYQAAASHIHVPNEVINQWEDWVKPDWRDHMIAPVFTQDEIQAIADFYSAWESVASRTPDPLPRLDVLFGTKEWQKLAQAALSSLEVFQIRGHLPDSPAGA